jgi:tellurite resistance protein TehA-like permease
MGPAAGAAVMGTGIASSALALDGEEALSRVLLAVTAAMWIGLALSVTTLALRDPGRIRKDAQSPTALTGVAGTAVLGTRLTLVGWAWAGFALLAVAVALWVVLLGTVLSHWETPTVGVSLLLTVSIQSVAILAAVVGASENAVWLVAVALAPFLAGLVLYGFVIARFDLHQLVTGRGDQWITGGALAISALAAARITLAAESVGALGGITGALEDASIALWAATLAWLPVLLVTEVAQPRLGYDVRRWSTVFPVGMYAVCSFVVGTAASASGLTDFAEVWVWVAVAVWAVVFAGSVRRAQPFSPRVTRYGPG